MTLPSQEYLISRIDYDPTTGIARWKPVDSSYGRTWKRFNDTVAGTTPVEIVAIKGTRYSINRILYKLYYGYDPKKSISYKDGNGNNKTIDNLLDSGDIEKKVKDTAVVDTIFRLAKPIPTTLSDYLVLDHVTGNLHWKPRDNNTKFNNQYAGKVAGTRADKYVIVLVNGEKHRAHRLVWALYYGIDPGQFQIDHIDTNKHNNAVSNLRLASNSFNNSANKLKTAKGYYLNSKNKYVVSIGFNNKSVHIGSYDTTEEAAEAYESAVELYKPIYKFTQEEQAQLDLLYSTYPNCDPELQRACHELQVKALNHYVDAAIVQTPKANVNIFLQNP